MERKRRFGELSLFARQSSSTLGHEEPYPHQRQSSESYIESLRSRPVKINVFANGNPGSLPTSLRKIRVCWVFGTRTYLLAICSKPIRQLVLCASKRITESIALCSCPLTGERGLAVEVPGLRISAFTPFRWVEIRHWFSPSRDCELGQSCSVSFNTDLSQKRRWKAP